MYGNLFVSAVIVAAGSSSRMKSNISKQLMLIGDKPVLHHTVSAFVKSGVIDEIIVVCPENDIEKFKLLFEKSNIKIPVKFTTGGKTRQESVSNGVRLTSDKCNFIAIHDGARPLVTSESIEKVISDAVTFGASTLAVPVKDTIKLAENNTVVETPPRDKLYIIQTPQVFDKVTYQKAYENALLKGRDFTDDCQLIESIGGSVHITVGDYTNIKITTGEDIAVAEAFLKLRDEV